MTVAHISPKRPPYLPCLVDDNNANIAVIKVSGSFPIMPFVASPQGVGKAYSSPGPSEISDLITLDAGQHWHLLPNYTIIDYLASVGSRIYAFIGTDPHWAGEPLLRTERFVVSSDGMQSWQQHTLPPAYNTAYAYAPATARSWSPAPGLRPENGRVGYYPEFYGDPASGDLLLILDNLQNSNLHLLRSSDGGNSWNAVPTPAVVQQIAFSIPSTQHAWTLCFTDNVAIWCSANTGRSWQPHRFSDVISFDKGNYGAILEGIASNGDLLALKGDSVESLAASANQWRILGTVPGGAGIAGIFGPAQGNVLWAIYGATSQWYAASYPIG